MRRILFVFHVSSVGGGSYCLYNLLKAIDRTVFEPVVLLPGYGSLCDEISKLDIRIEYMPGMSTYPYSTSLLSYRSVRKLMGLRGSYSDFAGFLEKESPEIVYFNSLMLFPYLRIAKRAGCKTVLHVREHWVLGKHPVQLASMRKAVYRHADRLVAINRYSASIFPKMSAAIVYDWIDMDSRKGPSLADIMGPDGDRCKVYLFLGGTTRIKGALQVIRTFSSSIVGEDRRLLVLGVDPSSRVERKKGLRERLLYWTGDKAYEAEVIASCRQDPRVVCAPALYEIATIMEQAAGYVSFFTIPHANLALAESVISQLPAVVARTDESLEYSEEGRLCLLYGLGDLDEFKSAWLKLDADPTALEAELASGSERVAARFAPDRNGSVFNQVLKSL